MSTALREHIAGQLTRKQRKLMKRHGTPAEFAVAVYKAVPGTISMQEAQVAIGKYQLDWDAAGSVKP